MEMNEMKNEDEGVSVATLLELLGDGESNIEIQHEEEDVKVTADVEKPVDNLQLELDLQCKEAQVDSELNCTVEPVQTLNARGMPVRKRNTTNTYCYDDSDDEDFTIKPSRRSLTVKNPSTVRKSHKNNIPPVAEQQKSSISKNVATTQVLGIKIGTRLRHVLKLPKSFRWLYCEWFYSDIDKCLFFNYNDFEVCLKTHFPSLKTRMMTRTEWNQLRRLLGKRRRCSDAFFQNEREILANKRKKIHILQQPTSDENLCFEDLPLEIPMTLVAGTKVTARLYIPWDGIFDGFIETVDYCNNTYRIFFGRNLGIHSVPDVEVLSTNLPDIFVNKKKQFNKGTMPGVKKELQSIKKVTIPKELLFKIVLAKKLLAAKEQQVILLSSMNRELEVSTTFKTSISHEFEEKYAHILIHLENINGQLKLNLEKMSFLMKGITPESHRAPSYLMEKCKQETFRRVQQISNANQIIGAENTKLLDLVSDIRYLMLISRILADKNEKTHIILQNVQGSLENLEKKFKNDEELFLNFSENVEVHFKYILMLLSKNRNPIQ